jgi:hypothetical protein
VKSSRRSFLRALAVGIAAVAVAPVEPLARILVTPSATIERLDEPGATLGMQLSMSEVRAAYRTLKEANGDERFTMVLHPDTLYDLASDEMFGIKLVSVALRGSTPTALSAYERRGAA